LRIEYSKSLKITRVWWLLLPIKGVSDQNEIS